MNDDQIIQAAASALERGNPQRAREHLQALPEPSAQVWHLKAVSFQLEGRHSEAVQAVQRGLSMEPGNLALRLLHADLVSDERPGDAEALYLGILNDYPNEPDALLSYAWLLATQGDADGAGIVMDRVPGHIRANAPQALGIDGLIALHRGKMTQSREFLDRGLQRDPNSLFLHSLQVAQASVDRRGGKRMVAHMGTAAATDPRLAAGLGYEGRYLSHPLMAPIRLVDRVGTVQLWIGWIIFIMLVRQFWTSAPLGWIVLGYLTFAIYTWITPPLLRFWLKRKGQL